MKNELLDKLKELLSAENPLDVQKEFKAVSAQFKSLTGIESSSESKPAKSTESTKETPPDESASQNLDTQTNAASNAAESGEKHGNETPSETSSDHTSEISTPHPTANDSSDSRDSTGNDPTTTDKAADAQDLSESKGSAEPVTDSAPSPNAPEKSQTENETAANDHTAGSENGGEQAAEKSQDPSKLNVEDTAATSTKDNPEEVEKGAEAVVENAPPPAESGHSAEEESEVQDPYIAEFKELASAFKAKLSAARTALKRIEEETVATAKDLLSELQNLVENEENIGKAFAGFNAIQEKWKSLPKVSNDNYRDLNAEYNKLIERFFYNINIYKELKELDLKRNLEEKHKVLETQKNLLDVNDIRLLEVEVRMNQDRWNEIGPTFKEEWDKIKDEFWEVTRTIYKKIQDFYNLRKEEQERNLEVKKELLETVKQIEALDLRAHKKWQEKTKEVIELQKKWKLVGFVPKDKAKSIWKEFRQTCDSFFEKKRAHYAEIHKEQNAHKEAKEALLKEAEELKDSTEWKETANRLIKLQKQWKEIGAAHQRDENRLWKKFRAACDHFFEARNAQKVEDSVHEKENLQAKEELLKKLEAFAPNPSDKSAIEELKSFSESWRQIGHVPFKEKDKVNKAYKQLMDEKFAILKVDKREKQQIRFEEKIDLLKSSDAKDKLVRKEQDFIRSKISKIESEINQYENNLGFFANSKGAEKLKEEVMKKIDKAKEDVDALYAQLEVLDEVE